MSTWIFKAAVAATVLVVAGCGGGRFAGTGTSADQAAPASRGDTGQQQIVVADSTVVVAGPPGFCVDPTSSRPNGAQPFVLFGNCAAITRNDRAPQPGVKAVLTASVLPSANPNISEAAMSQFLSSEDGRRALSRANDPSSVTVIDSFEKDGIHYVRTRDTSDGPIEDLDAEYWRAYFGVNDQLISASVLGFRDSRVTSEAGLEILQIFSNRIRSESPAKGTLALTAVAAPVTPAVTPETPARTPRIGGRTLQGVGLFRRILG